LHFAAIGFTVQNEFRVTNGLDFGQQVFLIKELYKFFMLCATREEG
jgi:hypothetical protein